MMQTPYRPRFFSLSAVRSLLAASLLLAALAPVTAQAGAQIYEPLADSVREALSAIVADAPVAPERIRRDPLAARWIDAQSERLARRVPDPAEREELLATVYYESARAGLDPELVLGLIEAQATQFLGGATWANVWAFILLIIVLVFRPQGLLGAKVVDRA